MPWECTKSHSQEVAELGTEPRLAGSRVCALSRHHPREWNGQFWNQETHKRNPSPGLSVQSGAVCAPVRPGAGVWG